ncbi:leucine/isoleucine/valine transporter ATP-binding subunit [compost metagenome]
MLREQGMTVIMITHDMHLMLEYADRAVVLSDGIKLADDSPERVLTDIEVVRNANLKETSLFTLAMKVQLDQPEEFVRRFIAYDRRSRGG